MTEHTPSYEIPPDTEHAKQLLAARLESHPTSMAWVLATYRKREGLSVRRLQETLGLTDTQMSRLALCNRPRTQAPDFADDVKRIAEHTGVDVTTLAQLVRTTDSLDSLPDRQLQDSQVTAANPATNSISRMMAARDRSADDLNEARYMAEANPDSELYVMQSFRMIAPQDPESRRRHLKSLEEGLAAESPETPDTPPLPDDKDTDKPDEPLAGQ